MLRKYTQRRFKRTEISYSMSSLVSRKVLCVTCQNSVNWVTSRPKHSKYLKNVQTVLVWYLLSRILILVYSCTDTSSLYSCLEDNTSTFYRVRILKLRTLVHKQPFSSACERYNMYFWNCSMFSLSSLTINYYFPVYISSLRFWI